MKGSTIIEELKTVFGNPKKAEAEQTEIGVEEAHSLWTLLANRYLIRDQLNLLKNFTHDKDFMYIIKEHIDLIDSQINILEKHAKNYSIMPPEPNTRDLNATGSSETMIDKRSSQLILAFIKNDITVLARAIKDSHINDDIREIFSDFTRNGLGVFDSYVKFLKLKNWIDFPPLYKYSSPSAGEIAANEVYLLWDHLVSRYHNIRLTQICVQYANDKDLKVVLELGLNTLTKQATTLENLLLKYAVTLPEHYTQITPAAETTEVLEDKFIFNTVMQGIVQASALHINAIQEIIYTDDMRKFFIGLSNEEMTLMDRMRKFGKLKGWTYTPPKFTIGQK